MDHNSPFVICVRLHTVLIDNKASSGLMAEKKAEKCAHPGCNCTVPKGRKYCSPYCQSVAIESPVRRLRVRAYGVCCRGSGGCSGVASGHSKLGQGGRPLLV